MSDFIDARYWPLAHLHMPAKVPDEEAAARLCEIVALYIAAEPFVLIMDGVELPSHSPLFVTSYAEWSRDNFELQQRYCLGAIRIEADPTRRQAYEHKAKLWRDSGRSPYPYVVVATPAEAKTRAGRWLSQHRRGDLTAAAALSAVPA